jgi:hypothetical protein
MAITINWEKKIINVPKADLIFLGGDLYELNVNTFRLFLKDLEDDTDGISYIRTHNHSPQVTVGGVTIARVVEIINGYTITFEDGLYAVRLSGANNNILDVTNINQVSVQSTNSAGLVNNDVWGELIESNLQARELLRLVSSVLFGKVSGAGTGTEKFRDINDIKDRITAVVDGDGNRISVSLDKN